MSVAAASGAARTQHQQATQEQIRLAQLIDDKKHDHPEVQEIIRKVLDVVAHSNQDDALLALLDCDYDCERAVALLIEKGHDVASEWRTATNHKIGKKQKTNTSARNGHDGEPDENGQQQRYNDGFPYRGKSRGGRGKFQQPSNGADSQNNQQPQPNDAYVSQQRSRGPGGGGYRGRPRGNNRGGRGGHDRNYLPQQQQLQDSTADSSTPSDTNQQVIDVSHSHRRGGSNAGGRSQPDQQWDVGNWNGETLIYSRTAKEEEEQTAVADANGVPNSSNALAGVANGQSLSVAASSTKNVSEPNAQQKGQSEFDPVEAARQIKNVIGIGQVLQQQLKQQSTGAPKSLMELKSTASDPSTGQQGKSKGTGQNLGVKATPSPSSMQRIPHQPVVFSDRFNGGLSKIDVQFGNLGELPEDTASSSSVHKASVPASTAFYPSADSASSATKLNNPPTSLSNAARSTTVTNHPSNEQPSFISPTTSSSSTRPSDQVPVINQQRLLPIQLQQQQQASMTMKPVVPSPYAVHQPQAQMNPANMVMHSLFLHHQHQQQEPVTLDNSYDPTAFQLQSADFSAPYYMAAALNTAASQQQAQTRYLVSQPVPGPAQVGNTRPASTGNTQTSSAPTSSSASTLSTATSSTATAKKGPAVPPGIFLPSTQTAYSAAYPGPYGVPLSVGGQQPAGGASYPALYDTEHPFVSSFMQYTNPQQAQSPSGTYGSVTPPVQQQQSQHPQQQAHNSNDNGTINYRGSMAENLLQLQQISIQQSNNQQQGQQGVAHSPAQMNFFLRHPASGHSYPSGPQIVYAQAAAPMNQQQLAKQQGQHYNQNNASSGMVSNEEYYSRAASSSSAKDGQYMYGVPSGQPQQVQSSSAGQQQQGGNKQQTRGNNNMYNNNNQQGQQRPYQ